MLEFEAAYDLIIGASDEVLMRAAEKITDRLDAAEVALEEGRYDQIEDLITRAREMSTDIALIFRNRIYH